MSLDVHLRVVGVQVHKMKQLQAGGHLVRLERRTRRSEEE